MERAGGAGSRRFDVPLLLKPFLEGNRNLLSVGVLQLVDLIDALAAVAGVEPQQDRLDDEQLIAAAGGDDAVGTFVDGEAELEDSRAGRLIAASTTALATLAAALVGGTEQTPQHFLQAHRVAVFDREDFDLSDGVGLNV